MEDLLTAVAMFENFAYSNSSITHTECKKFPSLQNKASSAASKFLCSC